MKLSFVRVMFTTPELLEQVYLIIYTLQNITISTNMCHYILCNCVLTSRPVVFNFVTFDRQSDICSLFAYPFLVFYPRPMCQNTRRDTVAFTTCNIYAKCVYKILVKIGYSDSYFIVHVNINI